MYLETKEERYKKALEMIRDCNMEFPNHNEIKMRAIARIALED